MPSTRPPSPATLEIDPSWTVSQFVSRAPAALPILHQMGIDACCGGALSLAEAARRHGVAVGPLLEQLRAALAPTT